MTRGMRTHESSHDYQHNLNVLRRHLDKASSTLRGISEELKTALGVIRNESAVKDWTDRASQLHRQMRLNNLALSPISSDEGCWRNVKVVGNHLGEAADGIARLYVDLVLELDPLIQIEAATRESLRALRSEGATCNQELPLDAAAAGEEESSDADTELSVDHEEQMGLPECPICFELLGMERPPQILTCSHKVCATCWAEWVARQGPRAPCPLCRTAQ